MLSSLFKPGTSFDQKNLILSSSPYYLEVRWEDKFQLYTVMYSDKSPDEQEISIMKHLVGTIFSKDNDEIVGYGFERTKQLIIDPRNYKNYQEMQIYLQQECLENCELTIYEEGVKIIVYYFSERWHISTNRMIDAGKAYWISPKSFKEQFLNVCSSLHSDIAKQLLDENEKLNGPLIPGRSYAFILISPENRSLSPMMSTKILHARTTLTATLEKIEQDLGVPRPKTIRIFGFEDLIEKLKNLEYWMPGFILSGNQRYKILTQEYCDAKAVGGNTTNMFHHYLSLRTQPSLNSRFLLYYPQFRDMAKQIEQRIWNCARIIHSLYINYFVKKQPKPIMNKTIFVTLMQLHDQYRKTGKRRTLQHVYEHITLLAPILLNILLIKSEIENCSYHTE